MDNTISFKMTYVALKMFGKQLYSNVGSAISELVANGIDANADSVYVVIDARDAHNATVEICDNGTGMTENQIRDNYVKIGYNKRKASANPSNQMGRKGIGKLAALYLSDKFTIATKYDGITTPLIWKLDVTNMNDDDTPKLEEVSDFDFNKTICQEYWEKQTHGTMIYIENVDLKGFGIRGLESLERKLSTYFLENNKIFLNIIQSDGEVRDFKCVEKHIAYKNMVCIFADKTEDFLNLNKSEFMVKFKNKVKSECQYKQKTEIISLDELKGGDDLFSFSGEQSFGGINKKYILTGWVGVHCTIDKDNAKENDKEYFKSTYYNPNQLRLYVRNKLAVANMLDYLGIARAFANYIEGEVSFDILDDDDLPDIATAGRQDFDSTDPRFELLIEMLKVVGNALVGKRQALADAIKKEKEKVDKKITSNAKTNFAKEFEKKFQSWTYPKKIKLS